MECSKDLSADMVALRVAGTLLIALLFAVPTVIAGNAEGEIASTSQVRLVGSADVKSSGTMWALDEGAEVSGSGITIHIDRLVDRKSSVAVLGGVQGTGGNRETADHGESTFVLERTAAGARLAILPDAPSQISGSGARIQAIGSALVFGNTDTETDSCEGSLACAESLGGYEVQFDRAAADIRGDFIILAYGYTLTVLHDGTTSSYRSGEGETESPGGLETEDATLAIRIQGGTANATASSISRVYAQTMELETSGRLIADNAYGDLRVGARSYRAAGDRLELAGTPQLGLETRAAPGPLDPRHTRAEPVRHVDVFSAQVRGEVTTINLAATPVYQEDAVQVTGLGLVLAVIIGFAAYFWPIVQFHATSIAIPLYTRLAQPSLLDNEVRNGIYGIVRDNPGISARAAHRLSEQSWGTVVYHLRQLEAHHLVVSRRHGRARNYYENHGKYKGMEKQLACLRSDRARLLAAQVLKTPGLTQEALAQAADLAQPTTSYYVRKLVHATLVVEEREGRYVRYVPGDELARFLAASEPQASTIEPTSAAKA